MPRNIVMTGPLGDDARASQARALLDVAYPDGAPGELDKYYARHGLPAATFLVEEDNLVVGHLSVFERQVRIGEEALQIGLLGEIAIAADRRKQGLAADLVAHAHRYLRSRAIPFSVLFAFEPAVYASSGYKPMLNETRAIEADGQWRTYVFRGGMVAELSDRPWSGKLLDLCGTAV
jgi:predicted N-acetyltransferase YhbS